jgi:hypothetical protein
VRPPIAASRLLTAIVAVVVVLAPTVADAVGRGDPRSERERVRRQQAELAAQIDVLKASQSEMEAALDAANANVHSTAASAEDARRAAEQAQAAAAQALAEEQAAEQQLEALRVQIRTLAVEAYMRPAGDASVDMLSTNDLNEAVQRKAMLDFQAGRGADAVDQWRAAEEDLSVKRDAADRAAAEADARSAEVDAKLAEVKAARDQQKSLADQVNGRVEHALSEAANLASLDADLARKIEEDNKRLLARSGGGSARSGGRVDLGSVSVVWVRGIQVNTSIADQVDRMLGAAAGDGIDLGGSGYRDPADQIRLREQNCPDTWNSSPSSCRPPTARPGESNHERGLAIDFTCNGGGVIKSRDNVCFRWLANNAGSYGFYNLPSEPWHWSVNGQ